MKNISFIVLLAVAFLGVNAQDPLSLSDAIATGLEKNYDLQVIRNTEEIAGINNTWGNTSLMPSISFSTSAMLDYNFNDSENYHTKTIYPDLSLSWVLFNGFSARINKARFEELEKQSQGNTQVLVESTIQDIILAYYNCLLQQEMLDVYRELAELSEDRYKRSMESKELGASTTYEMTLTKTSWLEDQSNYLQQKLNFDNAVRTLNFLMAVDDNSEWVFVSEFEADTKDYDFSALNEKMLSANSNLKNQYISQSLLEKETALAKSAYYPSVAFSTEISNTDYGKYYSGSTANLNSNYTDSYVGLSLSWTIFNGGSRKRSVKIAQINEESAEVQTSQMEHSLKNQLLQMFSNYKVQKAVLDLADEQEASAKLNLELSDDKLKNGSINSFNYRDAQINYMNAAINKYRAMYNLIQADTDLSRITGGIISEYADPVE